MATDSEVGMPIEDGDFGFAQRTMRAWVCHGPGEDLVLEPEWPVPEVPPGHVRVRITCAGLNPVDWKRSTWEASDKFKYPFVPGLDGVGYIDEVNLDDDDGTFDPEASLIASVAMLGISVSAVEYIRSLRVGTRVYFHSSLGISSGTFAEYAIVPFESLIRVRKKFRSADVAALPCAGWTAFQAVHSKCHVMPAHTVLVTGASGGVGGFACLLAKEIGARVIGTCSGDNAEWAEALGADVVIDYKTEDVHARVLEETGGVGVHCVIDTVGPESAAEALKLLRFGGHLCSVAGAIADPPVDLFSNALSVHYVFLGGAHDTIDEGKAYSNLRRIGDTMLTNVLAGMPSCVTEKVEFENLGEVFARRKAGERKCGKTVVTVAPSDSTSAAQAEAVIGLDTSDASSVQ